MIKMFFEKTSRLPYCRLFIIAGLFSVLCLFGSSETFAQEADLAVMKSATETAQPGDNLDYTIIVNNFGLDSATDVTVIDNLPGDTTFVSLTQNSGPIFNCSTPQVGSGGTVSCSVSSFDNGDEAVFTLTVNIPSETSPGTSYTNFATVVSSTFDPNEENSTASATTTVGMPSQADLSVTTNARQFVRPGNNLEYMITVNNFGPDSAADTVLTDTLPGDATFVSLMQNSGPNFNCSTPPVGAGGTISCTLASFASTTEAQFTLMVNIPNGAELGTTYDNTVTVASSTSDPNEENGTSSATTTVAVPTAALVQISGRAVTAKGGGISGVLVRLTDMQGQQKVTTTSSFGYYSFTNIPAGQVYIISISAKKYSFTQPEQVLNLAGEMNDINFVANN